MFDALFPSGAFGFKKLIFCQHSTRSFSNVMFRYNQCGGRFKIYSVNINTPAARPAPSGPNFTSRLFTPLTQPHVSLINIVITRTLYPRHSARLLSNGHMSMLNIHHRT